jgi:hypothetical protein
MSVVSSRAAALIKRIDWFHCHRLMTPFDGLLLPTTLLRRLINRLMSKRLRRRDQLLFAMFAVSCPWIVN